MGENSSDEDDDLFGGGSDSDAPPDKAPATTTSETTDDDAIKQEVDGTSAKNAPLSTQSLNSIPIPRTSPPTPTSPSTASAPRTSSSTNGSSPLEFKTDTSTPEASKFGLPAKVNLPKSLINSNLLKGRLLETLLGLPIKSINDALTEYDDAVQIKGESIRNHGAYLYGVIKRYISVQERALTGESQAMGPALTPAVVQRLATLVKEKFCTKDEMNEKVKSKIGMLSERDAILAIDELASVSRHQIRNFGSYFMGILNRYMLGKVGPGNWGNNHNNKQQRIPPPPPNRQHNDYDRLNHRPRHSSGRNPTNDHNESYRRERSRDRFDHKKSRHGNFPAPPNNMMRPPPHYDPRQSGQPPFPSPAGHSYRQPPAMGGMLGKVPPPPPPRTAPPGLNTTFSRHIPPPPPTQGMQSAPQQQHLGGFPPSSYGQPVIQHPPAYPDVPSFAAGVPQISNSGNSMMYGNSPPIIGQQPPQSSYINNPAQQHHQHSTSSFSQPGVGWQQQQLPPQQQRNTVGVMDLVGLADKAASVVQSLQTHPSPRVGTVASQPQISSSQLTYPQMMMQQQQPQQHQSYQESGYPQMMMNQPPHQKHHQPQKRRRTTAKMEDLPVTVQYAINNLQATGQIDRALDEGILGMINDLPEGLSMQALNKFAGIDKNTMRNKTAYLAGVLRRELEKINRR